LESDSNCVVSACLPSARWPFLQASAHAQLTIEITGAGANRIPVAIADFGGEASAARVVTSVVRGDLERSGLFKMIDPGGAAMTEASAPVYEEWKSRGADALAAGSIGGSDDGRQEARFRLYDVNKQSVLGGSAFVTSKPMLRAAGHRIADMIYEKLTGEPGIFSTRVAYVVRASAARYELHISDADGQNAQVALISKEPIISPSWSPDGRPSGLCFLRKQEAGGLCALTGLGKAHRRGQLQGFQLGAGVVA
jgi:TolB protein